jgi:hypothetical protein
MLDLSKFYKIKSIKKIHDEDIIFPSGGTGILKVGIFYAEGQYPKKFRIAPYNGTRNTFCVVDGANKIMLIKEKSIFMLVNENWLELANEQLEFNF